MIHTLDVRLGAARNAAAKAATGEYVVFIDDDNIPLPQMIETLVRAAQHAKLDVATCLAYILSGNQAPTADYAAQRRLLPRRGTDLAGSHRQRFRRCQRSCPS